MCRWRFYSVTRSTADEEQATAIRDVASQYRPGNPWDGRHNRVYDRGFVHVRGHFRKHAGLDGVTGDMCAAAEQVQTSATPARP